MSNSNSNIFKVLSVILIITILFTSVSCTKGKDGVQVDYVEYISSFYKDNTLNMFEFSENLDLESSIHLAFVLKQNDYKISDKNKETLKNAFYSQIIKSEYKLGELYINNSLGVWSSYLQLLDELNNTDALSNLKDENRKMLSQVISSWEDSINQLNINQKQDLLTRLNILLQLKNINKFVNDIVIASDIEKQITLEYNNFMSQDKTNLSEQLIPLIYYFSNLGINSLEKYKDEVFSQIDQLLQNIEVNNYNGYFFYLPFIYDVMEQFEKSSFNKKYKGYNLNAINFAMTANMFDWNSLWAATCLTDNSLTPNEKKALLTKMSIDSEMDISQPQIIYLSDTYSNIYYYLNLSKIAQLDISSSQSSCINEILKTIKDKNQGEFSVKECYYSLKLKEFNFVDSSLLLSNEIISSMIQKYSNIDNVNLHDAGSVYYLMLLERDFKLVGHHVIENLLNEQQKIISIENIDSSIFDSLTYMFDMLNGSTSFDDTLFNDLNTFQEKIYFISALKINPTQEQKRRLYELIDSYSVQYGYSSRQDDKKLELESTYRMVNAIQCINI